MHSAVLLQFCSDPTSSIPDLEAYRARHRLTNVFFRETLPNGETALTTCLRTMIRERRYDPDRLVYLLDQGARSRNENRYLDLIWSADMPVSAKCDLYTLLARYKLDALDSNLFPQLFRLSKEERDTIWKCISISDRWTLADLGVMQRSFPWNGRDVTLLFHTSGVLPEPDDSDIWVDRYDTALLSYILSSDLPFSERLLERCTPDPSSLPYFFSYLIEDGVHFRLPVSLDQGYQFEIDEDFRHPDNTTTREEIEERYADVRRREYAWWDHKFAMFQWLLRSGMHVWFTNDHLQMMLVSGWRPHPLDRKMSDEFDSIVRSFQK
jgi:hypothetical protein